MKSETTLQINLSPGDVGYAAFTVPALVKAHPDVAERLLVVDICKPPRTRIVDPSRRFPEPAYTERVNRILAIAETLKAEGRVDRVVVLRPGDARFPQLARKYLRPWLTRTHDYGGCALMAYLAAFELCRTRFLLHYDADMLLHQDSGYDWAPAAVDAMARSRLVIAASPRQAPPVPALDQPTLRERLALTEHPHGWLNTWFSTRCYLFDLQKLAPRLPLLQGRWMWETWAARLTGRGFPRSPEVMLHRHLSAAGDRRLTLRDERAWMLHPVDKGAAFQSCLPTLLAAVERGAFPPEQAGRADLDLTLPGWREILHDA